MRHLKSFWHIFLRISALWLALSWAAVAQDQPSEINYTAWESVAQRAETAVEAERASSEAFESLRSEVVVWRERFLRGQDTNSARIATITSQIEALGPAPTDGETESAEIATRRQTLVEQLATARAPIQRAEEAYSRANGITGEIDKIIRERQTDALLRLGPTPLSPANWIIAADELRRAWRVISTETTDSWRSPIRQEALRDALPKVILLALIALVFLVRGSNIINVIRQAVNPQLPRRLRRVAYIVWSAADIYVPILGIYAAASAIAATGLLGLRTTTLVEALPVFGIYVFGFYWLGKELFRSDRYIDIEPAQARVLHRSATILGLLYGLTVLLEALTHFDDLSDGTVAVLYLPFAILAALALLRMGRMLVRITNREQEQADIAQAPIFGLRWLKQSGRITQVLAVAGAVMCAVGYQQAGLYFLQATIGTLALVGVLFVLNRLMREIYSLVVGGEIEGTKSALIPTLLSFVLALTALPFFALIWGARTADLNELWARFREGFTLGDARISPEKFLTFVLVFVALYIATRVVQGALRSNVLPKTRIDTGGQTAIVSGVGYIGIFLAALIAISTAGIDLSSLAIVAGALSVGIGFGLQNIVQNFVSGIILLIERPVAEGDWVQVGSTTGIVKKISVRSTLIETFDKVDVVVPNGDFISSAVQNWTRTNNIGRIIITVGVAYGTDTRRVTEILREIADNHPLVTVNPEPGVDFLGFGADSLDFRIRAVLSDVNFSVSVKTELHHQIAERFAEEGIEIPFVQRDLWLRNPEALREIAATGGPQGSQTPMNEGLTPEQIGDGGGDGEGSVT